MQEKKRTLDRTNHEKSSACQLRTLMDFYESESKAPFVDRTRSVRRVVATVATVNLVTRMRLYQLVIVGLSEGSSSVRYWGEEEEEDEALRAIREIHKSFIGNGKAIKITSLVLKHRASGESKHDQGISNVSVLSRHSHSFIVVARGRCITLLLKKRLLST